MRSVLAAYAAAYVRLDAAAVQRIQPSVNADALSRSFASMKSYSLELRNVFVAVTGNTARVTCIWDSTFEGKGGVGGRQHQAPPATLTLQKNGTQWFIVDRR